MSDQITSAIYHPSRADQRAARQILADQRDGEGTPVLGDLAAGSLGRVIHFLAGCRGTFLLLALDEQRRFSAYGSPTHESVVQLALDLLGGQTAACAGREAVTSEVERIRLPWVKAAVEEIVDGLDARDIFFLLGWRLPGDEHARLDHSLGLTPEKISEGLGWYLSDRLGVHLPVSTTRSSCPETQHGHAR